MGAQDILQSAAGNLEQAGSSGRFVAASLLTFGRCPLGKTLLVPVHPNATSPHGCTQESRSETPTLYWRMRRSHAALAL